MSQSPSLELWQAEWCPWSHLVRQRLTELGVSFTAVQVPAVRTEREALIARTGHDTIPVLCAGETVVTGADRILDYLAQRFTEPAGAAVHRERAAEIEQQHLEDELCAAQ